MTSAFVKPEGCLCTWTSMFEGEVLGEVWTAQVHRRCPLHGKKPRHGKKTAIVPA